MNLKQRGILLDLSVFIHGSIVVFSDWPASCAVFVTTKELGKKTGLRLSTGM